MRHSMSYFPVGFVARTPHPMHHPANKIAEPAEPISSTRRVQRTRTRVCFSPHSLLPDVPSQHFLLPPLQVGLLYKQYEPTYVRPTSLAFQRCLVRW